MRFFIKKNMFFLLCITRHKYCPQNLSNRKSKNKITVDKEAAEEGKQQKLEYLKVEAGTK